MIITVLGPGCPKCVTLERITRDAVAELGLDATVTKVEDYPTIMSYGVMSSPALVIDERVVLVGRVPTPAQLRDLLTASTVRLSRSPPAACGP